MSLNIYILFESFAFNILSYHNYVKSHLIFLPNGTNKKSRRSSVKFYFKGGFYED